MSSRDWWGRAEQQMHRQAKRKSIAGICLVVRLSISILPGSTLLYQCRGMDSALARHGLCVIYGPSCFRNIAHRFRSSSSFFPCAPCASLRTRPDPTRHVVVVVWDGMRPDFVSEETTPTLWKLAREGVTFRNHHAVYPSATQVNGTALVTGVYPGQSSVIANYAYRPEIDRKRSISVESPTVVSRGDELSGGKFISVPTIAELIQRAGGQTAIASAKTVGLLLDRHADSGPAKNCVTLFAGQTLPRDVLTSIVAALGPFPSAHVQRDPWTTKAVTDFLWKDGVPALSVIWLGEPDLTEHESAPARHRRSLQSNRRMKISLLFFRR